MTWLGTTETLVGQPLLMCQIPTQESMRLHSNTLKFNIILSKTCVLNQTTHCVNLLLDLDRTFINYTDDLAWNNPNFGRTTTSDMSNPSSEITAFTLKYTQIQTANH